MKPFPLLVGGVVAGLIIIAGESLLNLVVLTDEWANLLLRFALPQPTPLVAAQGVLKLLLLGIFSVWLAVTFRPTFPESSRAGVVSGLCVWFLVWAWVQWGMLLAGFVTAPIAVATVAWGFVELPLAAWAGTWMYWQLNNRSR
ncbi:MAG: hypothetical protein LUQ11_11305 [Methylococcaceae bacterium]|nr:hypothetical protein [Methylococcaceae bacterium]